MKLLVIGNGGREHAIVWKLRKDDPAAEIFCAPGNAGTSAIATNVPIAAKDIQGLVAWAKENKPDFTIVGPEVPLCLGVVDEFQAAGLSIFGPNKAAAQMEGSKEFAKGVMQSAQVPTAEAVTVHTAAEARDAVAKLGIPVVLKADGLAAGKGVSVCMDEHDVDVAISDMFETGKFGSAAASVLVEQYLEGEEASLLAFVDGEHVALLPSAQDHKRLLDDDKGPNTGGMGAYSPAPAMTPDMLAVVESQVFLPVVRELKARGIVYRGILYAGLMLTSNGPKVLEFNARFGDPETQAVLARLETPLLEPMKACLNGTLDQCQIKWTDDPAVCVVMVAGGYPESYAKGNEISGLAEASVQPQTVVFHAGTKLSPEGKVLTDGGRVLGVTATGNGIRDAVANAYRAVLKIGFDGAFYRSDIAHRALERLS